MARYLDPKSDLIFKKIFGNHPNLLKSFLNALLPLPPENLIETLEYLPTENVPEIPEFKYTIVDVRCQDKQGRHFVVEMQISWSRHFMQRFLFNTASVYVRQLGKGIDYQRLSPVYGFALVDDFLSEETNCFHHYQLTHAKNSTLKLNDIHLVLLELPKFKPITMTEKKLSVLWLRFMTEINEKTIIVDEMLLSHPEINEALALTEEAAYTPEELEAYDRNWDAIRTEKTLIKDKLEEGFEKGHEKGHEKGLKKGRKEGLEKGREEGLKKGREEGLEKGREEREHEIARNFLSDGLKAESVAKNTGLILETVLKIQESLAGKS